MFDIDKPYKMTRRKDDNGKYLMNIVENEKPYWKSSKPKNILELNKNADWSSFTNID